MTDPHPIMALMLQASQFVGQATTVEDEIQPLPEQLSFGVGDAAILASANTPLERDFAVLRGLDPEEHAETFPDWEERMLGTTGVGWSSHVLCEHFSRDDPEVSIGWFSRVKLLPIAQYRYKEARRWLKKGFPEEIPEWAHKYYQRYTDNLSQHAPHRVPRTVQCPNCKSRDVELLVSRRIVYSGRAGILKTLEDKDKYLTVTDPHIDDTHTAQLHCTDCDSSADLTDEEWELPGISS